MADVPRSLIDDFSDDLNNISESFRLTFGNILREVEWDSVEDLRDKTISLYNYFGESFANIAASRAADFYDDVRELQTGSELGAYPDSKYSEEATENSVRALVGDVMNDDGTKNEAAFDKFVEAMLERADREIKRSAGACVKSNAWRDRREVRYARVPSGSETCRFCIMLASRGFAYKSGADAGDSGHYHANCDCRIVPTFGNVRAIRTGGSGSTDWSAYKRQGGARVYVSDQGVEGYNPVEWFNKYSKMVEDGDLDRDALAKSAERSKAKSNRSAYSMTVAGKKFESFNDVKRYVYGATDEADLRRRISQIRGHYGSDITPNIDRSLTNVERTTSGLLGLTDYVARSAPSKAELGAVTSAVNTVYDARFKGEPFGVFFHGDHGYTFKNNGFDDYEFTGRWEL